MPKQVIFKNYIGASRTGKPSAYDCSCFGATDLISMLQQPADLPVVSFRTGHQIWADELAERMVRLGGRKAAEFSNRGIAAGLAEIGYRIVPTEEEIVIR